MASRLSRRHFGLSLLAPALPAVLAGCRRRTAGEPHDAALRPGERVEIDVSRSLGGFDRLSGVQGSPAPIVEGEPERVREFRAAGIRRVRFPQDCYPNTLTLGGVFPDENADPDAAASYRFAAIDRHVSAARAAGSKILWQSSYDVGRTDRWNGLNLGGRAPVNMERWCKVVSRCLDHFNAGWAEGLRGSVDAVEFVNEPDGLGGFNGEDAKRLGQAFIEFLDAIERWNGAHPAVAVRAVGPGIPLSLAEWKDWRPRFDAALTQIAKRGRTWAVFSFHTYGADVSPQGNEKLARELRALLDRHGMNKTELWNTEWLASDFLRAHLSLDTQRALDATDQERRRFASAAAAYAVACKLRWQGVVSGSCYYRANRRAFPPGRTPPQIDSRVGEGPFFHADGSLAALGLEERLLGQIADTTPARCQTVFPDDGLLTAAGLRSNDGRKVSVVISNLDLRMRNLDLCVRGGAVGALGDARLAVLDERENPSFRAISPPRRSGDEMVVAMSVAPLTSAVCLLT